MAASERYSPVRLVEIAMMAPNDTLRYELFLPIARMWICYMAELLNLPPIPEGGALQPGLQHPIPQSLTIQPKLVKADFHGSIVAGESSKYTS